MKNIGLLGFCSDEGVRRNNGRPGAVEGPQAIRKFLQNHQNVFDYGDVVCKNQNLEAAHTELAQAVIKIFADNRFPILFGGGHEVAYGHFLGLWDAKMSHFLSKKIQKIGIINFDAHFDMRPYDNGANSGTSFLQIADHLKSRGEKFSYLILGIQQTSNKEFLFTTAKKYGVAYLESQEINVNPLEKTYLKLDDFISKQDAIYLTFCLDVFPKTVAPGVSCPNPFGLDPQKAFALFEHILKSNKVLSFDVAELAPKFDLENQTAKIAARLIEKICSL